MSIAPKFKRFSWQVIILLSIYFIVPHIGLSQYTVFSIHQAILALCGASIIAWTNRIGRRVHRKKR